MKTTNYRRSPKKNQSTEELDTSANLILSHLYTTLTPLSIKEMAKLAELKNLGMDKMMDALNVLQQAKLIQKSSKNAYMIEAGAPLYTGTLEQNPRGFGFVTAENKSSKQDLVKDIYISASQLGSSHHGDRVLVRVLRIKNNGRPEGTVVKVLSRGPDSIAGTFVRQNHEYLIYPDDPRFPFVISVEKPKDSALRSGDCVIAKYTVSEKPSAVQQGQIIEILGSPDKVTTQARLVIEKYHLPHLFNDATKEEIENINEDFSKITDREDFRATDHITIDGETAKDFDDAIYITQSGEGYRLIVSIADVSYFVKTGTSADSEAYLRGTSIYFPDSVIPMLPEKLSNDLCSLKPGRSRFTLSAILDFDKNANLLKRRFCRSVIQSKYRFTYTIVSEILADRDPEVRKLHKPFLAQLETAQKLASKLKQKRQVRGSVDFNLIEPEFHLTPDGKISSIEQAERTQAHQIIEEFMLAANEAVADYFSENQVAALYRIHESPDQEKLDQFLKFAATLGLALPQKNPHPRFLAEILENAKGSRYEYIINNLLLRSLQQARYSETNAGHFGLASPHYTHFTSPIRRYPDLVVHRLLLSLITDSQPQNTFSPPIPMKEAGESLSALERRAVSAERDIHNRLKIMYMSSFIGHQFEAIISGVGENGLYIEIQDLCVSGAISIEYLTDDHYLFDPKNYRLFGEISARTYQIGDPILVDLLEADLNKQKLHFSPSDR